MPTDFDIRNNVSDPANPKHQKGYDTINRMAFIVGDVPFKELYRTPFRTVLTPLIEKFREAQAKGILENATTCISAAEALKQRFEEEGDEISLYDLHVQPIPAAIIDDLRALEGGGLCCPFLHIDNGSRAAAKLALDNFFPVGGDLTYLALYNSAMKGHSVETIRSVVNLRSVGVIAAKPNDKICVLSECEHLNDFECYEDENGHCLLASQTQEPI